MRSHIFSALILGLALMWLGAQRNARGADSSREALVAPTNSLPKTNIVASLVGTWHWRDERQLIELSRDGRWRWWNLQEQSGRPSEAPLMSGKWFIHDGDMYLRIEQPAEGAGHGFGPGMAMVFEIRSQNAEALRLNRPGSEEYIVWKMIAERGGAANGGQPIRVETNSTSGTAGPRR